MAIPALWNSHIDINPIPSEIILEIGPITRKIKGAVISIVNIGTIKIFTIFGVYFFTYL